MHCYHLTLIEYWFYSLLICKYAMNKEGATLNNFYVMFPSFMSNKLERNYYKFINQNFLNSL